MDIFKSFESGSFLAENQDFEQQALELFRYQVGHNRVYQDYVHSLRWPVQEVSSLTQIPFLPIGFFKTQKVTTGNWSDSIRFSSSGTTGMVRSVHYLPDLGLYQKVATAAFEQQYGPLKDYHVLALLPSYQEGSSLVTMVEHFIHRSGSPESGFYLEEGALLVDRLDILLSGGRKVLLIGVSFALLDLAAQIAPKPRESLVVMETGGMKGRRKEITREELHNRLESAFGVQQIHSEYGMTELLSQAYSRAEGIFQTPFWMRILIRDPRDPFELGITNRSGGINVIDLANIYSCAFVETNDIGLSLNQREFQVLGRMDNSDLRGCNLLLEQD